MFGRNHDRLGLLWLVVASSACNGPQPARMDASTMLAEPDTSESNARGGIEYAPDAGLMRVSASSRAAKPDSGTPSAVAGAGGKSARDAGSQKPSNVADDDAGQSPAADGGTGCRPFAMPSDCTTPAGRVLPSELRCTGLYGDWAQRALACGVTAYRPAYELYSDGAQKQRWFALPDGGHIDGTRPEAFVFPVGTQFWKEFRVAVSGEQRLVETRLLRKISSAKNGWVYTSYVWNEHADKAVQTNDGANDVLGSDHVVPTLEQCQQCHKGREDFILGWDPIMLGPGAMGVDLAQLVDKGMLQNTTLPAPTIPGLNSDAPALGYLHANCGISCHNPNGDAKDSGLFMRLDADKLSSVEMTPTIATGLLKKPWENAKIQTLTPPSDGPFYDIEPLRSDASLILVRMLVRGSEAQMPPIATRHVDEAGVTLVRALIEN
jgi:hypothetical protein